MYNLRKVVVGNTKMALTYFKEKRTKRIIEAFAFLYKRQYPDLAETFERFLKKIEEQPELLVEIVIEKNKAEIRAIKEQIEELEKDPEYPRIYE